MHAINRYYLDNIEVDMDSCLTYEEIEYKVSNGQIFYMCPTCKSIDTNHTRKFCNTDYMVRVDWNFGTKKWEFLV